MPHTKSCNRFLACQGEPVDFIAGDIWTWRRDDLAGTYDPAAFVLSYAVTPEAGGPAVTLAAVADAAGFLVVCPSDDAAIPMNGTGLADLADFASADNISYDSLNLAATKPNLRTTPTRVYISDPNPLFVRARFDDSIDPDTTNSPAHGGRGQTILALGGGALWLTKPVYGKRNDNLWLAGNIRRYVGTESPVDPDDVQLIPGFPNAAPKSATSRTRY